MSTHKGIVTIDKFKAEFVDGEWVPVEHIETIEETNRMCVPLATQMQSDEGLWRNNTWEVVMFEAMYVGALSVRSDGTGPIQGTGNINSYTAPVGATDGYWEFQSTFNPGASTRQLRTIGMTTANSSYDQLVFCVVNLPTPCEQTNQEILQVTYRLVNDQSAVSALGNVNNYVTEKIFESGVTSAGAQFLPVFMYTNPYDSRVWGNGIPELHSYRSDFATSSSNTELYYDSLTTTWNNIAPSEGLVSVRGVLRLGKNNLSTSPGIRTGLPMKSVSLGTSWRWANIVDINTGSESRVQNVFGRAVDTGAIDRTPFLDPDIIATSAADVNVIDKGDWYGHRNDSYLLPYLYRINITTGGNVGTAEYNIQRRRITRFVDNSPRWISYGITLNHGGLVNGNTTVNYMDQTTADSRRHGQTIWHTRGIGDTSNIPNHNSTDDGDAGTIIQRYVHPEMISFDYDGITVFSMNEYKWTNLDANSAQAQTFTEILQVSNDGLDIYVADASQGLYQILRDHDDFNTSNWVVNKIGPPGITDDTSCRGVFHKGGTYWGGPGKIVDVNIVRAGSNYSVGDTISHSAVNGTGFAANVARVDADGGITSVAITNRGSGYIEDHCQLYVSSGNGVGASLEPIIGSGGDMWAIFNDTTDSFAYMAHMTHVGSNDYTSLNLDTTGETITRTGGTDFLVDGFRPGQVLHIKSTEDATNEGRYTINAVTSTVITLNENIPASNTADTQAQIFAESWEIMTETITDDSTSYNFNGAGDPDTITGNGTSFLTQGFREGMKIVISGSENTGENDGTYTIASVTATVITLDSQDTLVTNTADTTATLATLTDFTLTNHTSGTPGPDHIIGLVMDQEHADDRFAIITVSNGGKTINNGVTQQSTGAWSWWSFANSTGTTAAGTTDHVSVAGGTSSYALSGEQIATQCIGPTSIVWTGDTNNSWVVVGVSAEASARLEWGQGYGDAVSEPSEVWFRYNPHRCKTNFDIGVYGHGNDNDNALKSNRVEADYTISTEDVVINYTQDSDIDNDEDCSPGNYNNQGCCMGQLGHGLLWARNTNATLNGAYVFTGNGSGLKADEDALPYGFWQDFGWDGTRWVLDNVNSRLTHAQVSFTGTSLNINSTTGAIVGTGFASTDWAGDGFQVGDIITIATAEDATNNGSYVIESLSGTTLTVTPDKLPAVTNTADTTATVVGDHAIIDGLALSFDDVGATAPLVLNEYYDAYIYDGILNDNATSGTINCSFPFFADATGTTFEAATIPNSDVGAVVGEKLALSQKSQSFGNNQSIPTFYGEPGYWACAANVTNVDDIAFFEQQIPASTDFTLRFKVHGSDTPSGVIVDVGVVPYALVIDGSVHTDTNLDYNARVRYDFANYPTHDQYTIEIRNTGSGTVQHTENTNRVVLKEVDGVTPIDETYFDGAGSNGTFIGGFESATDNHAALDVITMNDGTIVTVDAVDGNGTITQFTITTNSTKSSGSGQIGAVSSSATSIDFNTTGNTITRTAGGTDFVTDGFRIGMKIQVDGATTEANDGAYTIATVSTTVITTEENLNTTETGTSATIDHCIVQDATTGSGVNFALIPGTANLEPADVGNDEYSLCRRGTTGNNIYWTLNGVEFYTHTAGPYNDNWGIGATGQNTYSGGIYDANIDYTIDRRYLGVGNGTTTGASDNNFRCLPTTYAGTNSLRLYYDTGSGPVEFTYVTDGRTAPASGEVTIMPFSGQLWFNTAQAGDTLTGNWTITKKFNLS